MNRACCLAAVLLLMPLAHLPVAASPWASAVVSYDYDGDGNPANDDPAFSNPQSALGEPARMSGIGTSWSGVVSMFSSAWTGTEVVTVMPHGHLTLSLDPPVRDDASHLYGIDLIVFGNAAFSDASWPLGKLNATAKLWDEPGCIELSADGLDWRIVPGVWADSLFPTQAFRDVGPYSTQPGALASNFLKPMNPARRLADFNGRTFAQALVLYDGSGGGAPVDIASVGLQEVRYVRITVPSTASYGVEIDALAAVAPCCTIQTQPVGLSQALPGDSAVFTVTATGMAPFSYQWRKDGLALVDTDRVCGTRTPTLTITAVTASDAGAYDVLLTCGTYVLPSDPAALTVRTPRPDHHWTWSNPLPMGITLNGVWGTGPSNVYAVGDAGTIVHYDGRTWSLMDTGTTNALNAIWGSGPADIFVVGDEGTILHYDGSTWRAMPNASYTWLHGVWGSGPTDVFVATQYGIWHYDGTAWASMVSIPGRVASVWGTAANDVFAASESGLYHYDGRAWSCLGGGDSNGFHMGDVWGSASNDLFAVGGWSNSIWHYDGATWSSTIVPCGSFWKLWGAAHDNVYAVGNGGSIAHYDGTAWSVMASGSENYLHDIWGSGPNDLFAVGDAGTILHYDGSAWSSMTYGVTDYSTHYAIWGSAANDVYVVGWRWIEDGTILHWDGIRWSQVCTTASAPLIAIWGSGPDDIYALSRTASVIYHYDGSAWSPQVLPAVAQMAAIWGSGPADVYVSGYDYDAAAARVLHYDGSAWSVMTSPGDVRICGIWGSGPGDVYAVGSSSSYEGEIYHFNGSTWSRMPASLSWIYPSAIWGTGPANVYVAASGGGAINSGQILHYDGSAWSVATVSTDDLNAIWGSGPADIYAAGDSGTILHYNGSTWTATASPSPYALNGIWGIGRDVFAVGELGSILRCKSDCKADLNNDDSVDAADLLLLAGSWAASPSSPNWNPACDLNADNRVNVVDLLLLADTWGM